MQLKHFSSLVLLLTYLTACSQQSSAEEVTQEIKTLKSWTATAQMVTDHWLRRDLPKSYAQQTLQKTQEELRKEQETISKQMPSAYQATLKQHCQMIASIVQNLTTAVEQDDRTTVSKTMDQLATEQKALTTISKTLGS